MVGNLVLQECLYSPEIEKITVVVRQSTGIDDKKITEVLHSDFTDFSSVKKHFKNQDIAYFCLGVYTGAVSREKFREITVDYTKAFAGKLKEFSPNATFCFLSGAGADSKEKSRMMFAQDKGIAENYLIAQQFGQTYIFRPAYIYPSVRRKEPNMTYRIMRVLYPVMEVLYPRGVITSQDLAKAIFITGLFGGNRTIYENKNIRAIG